MMRRKQRITSGIHATPVIRAAHERGDALAAQRLILDHLKREIDGTRTVAVMRGGRKVLRAVK